MVENTHSIFIGLRNEGEKEIENKQPEKKTWGNPKAK